MDLVDICREEGRKQATEWLKGAIDAPNPYALMATGARNSADDWLEMAGVHVHAGVREVITEAYWEKVGPMGVIQTLQAMFDELA